MKTLTTLFILLAMIFGYCSQAQVAKKPTPKKLSAAKTVKGKKIKQIVKMQPALPVASGNIKVKIVTDSGTIIVKLYDSTPLHRDNFVSLVKQGFYDSLLFHRIIKDFMIQGGDPTGKYAKPGAVLGSGGDNLTRIPAEFRKTLFHKKGVLAAARDNNPEKASSACQFYIVQGKTYSDADLTMIENQTGRKYTAAERAAYKTIGGTPFLDGNYTVFGEVISGLEVVDKIATAPKDGNDRPLGDIRMKMQLIK